MEQGLLWNGDCCFRFHGHPYTSLQERVPATITHVPVAVTLRTVSVQPGPPGISARPCRAHGLRVPPDATSLVLHFVSLWQTGPGERARRGAVGLSARSLG